jgi:3-phosphoshikimate 1-carboxyvinyltransferase
MAVTCAALNVEAEFSGIKNLRIKETDRIEALRNELLKISDFGFRISENGFSISASTKCQTSNIKHQTHHDHRMLLSFAPLAIPFG